MSEGISRAWDTANYQRIAQASGAGWALSVLFANGDEAEIDVRQLVDELDQEPEWQALVSDGYELTVPSGERVLEIPWLRIRALIDQDLAAYLARRAEEQASAVGHQLRTLRERRGLSSKEVAERAGMLPQALSRIERGRQDVVFSKVRRLLAAMDYDLEDLARVGQVGLEPAQVHRALRKIGLNADTIKRLFYGAADSGAMQKRTNGIFGWSTTDLAQPSGPPQLATAALSGRFKEAARDRGPGSAAYATYAHFLAELAEAAAERPPYQPPPEDPHAFAEAVRDRYGGLSFETVLRFLWHSGIVVLPLQDRGQFHGATWLIDGNPVIVLKQRLVFNSRWVFDLCHEICHVLRHLSTEEPALIELDAIGTSDAAEEAEASEWAGQVLLGDPHAVASKAAAAAGNFGPRLKRVLPDIAAKEDVDVGVLANYLAHRMSAEGHGSAMWGVANNLQVGDENALELALDLIWEHLNLAELDENERLLLEGALRPEAELE